MMIKTIFFLVLFNLITITIHKKKLKHYIKGNKNAKFLMEQQQFRMKQKNIIKYSLFNKNDCKIVEKEMKQYKSRMRFKQQLKQRLRQKQKSKNEDPEIQGPILKKGWLKFLIFDPREGEQMKNFYLNNAYQEEQKIKQLKGDSSKEVDEFGPLDIPDQFQFFFVLTNDQILVLSQRHNDLMKTQQIVYLNNIVDQNVNGDKPYEGGVEDQGNYKEGFCFKLNVANEKLLVWVLCSSDLNDKMGWMETISQAKIKQQMVSGTPQNNDSLDNENSQSGGIFQSQVKQSKGNGGDNEGGDNNNSNSKQIKDGYWIILQDWSTCTLACGGGTQTLHRFCVPPQNGGKPCAGSPVESKKCNTDPCPQDSDELLTAGLQQGSADSKVTVEQKVMPTKIKMMRVSKRMKRYERCIIKEGDLNILREDLKVGGRIPQIQARIVMNNKTISVFENDQYESVLFGQQLRDIRVKEYELDKDNCFTLVDKKQEKSVILCGIDEKVKEKQDWVDQIKFFKDNCLAQLQNAKGKVGSEGDDQAIKNDPLLNLKKKEIDEELAEKKQEENESNAESQELEQEKLKNSLQEVQKMAIDAMQQELKFESRMEKEEKEREKRLDLEMRQKLEEMREKEECVKRNIRKNQQKALGQESHNDIANKIQQIKESIRNMIITNREKHKDKLSVMRKISERKRQQQNKEIQEIKIKLASEVVDVEKKGNKETCFEIDNGKKEESCKEWFSDEIELKDCFGKQYCEMCCEKEFGENNMNLRVDCMSGCIKQEEEQTKNNGGPDEATATNTDPNAGAATCSDKKDGGNWVWVPETNSVKKL